MKPQSMSDYQSLLTQVIKKLIAILGPDITFAKLSHISNITVTSDGTVTQITGDPRLITHQLNDSFMELSGFVTKRTMEPLEKYTEGRSDIEHTIVEPLQPNQALNASAKGRSASG